MKIGDLVKYAAEPKDALGRSQGLVIRLDVYRGEMGTGKHIPIVEVLWETGPGWIDQERVAMVNELSDDQLENVHGGMSAATYDMWRVGVINGT